MDSNKTMMVLKKIRELTRENKLRWKEEADGTTFFASVNEYKVFIGKGAGTVTFSVFNNQNAEIGSLEWGGYSQDTEGLDLFYEEVRRKVLNIDNDLDDLLGHLDNLP